jgi:hypothetical protein
LRLAIAAYKLRDFKKLKAAANLGLALDPSEVEKEQLKEYVEKSKEQREITVDRNMLQGRMRQPSFDCDTSYMCSKDATTFTNLNMLHYAAVIGDVTLMEEVVARGAALDFPISDNNYPDIPPIPAPPGSTALLLLCATLAVFGEVERLHLDNFRELPAEICGTFDRSCECAIRLVHLGANCQVKLQIPARTRNDAVDPRGRVNAYRDFNLGGKTSQQLASMSRRPELICAIELMQKTENIHLTQCRCGSRLPWNQCHGGPVPGQSDLYIQDDNGRRRWRYSPKAMCPCKLTNKEHYKCCWFTSTPYYKDDSDGVVGKLLRERSFDQTTPELLRRLKQIRISEMDPNGPTVPEGTTYLIRSYLTTMLSGFNGRRCGVKDWDPIVYAGVLERVHYDFMWDNLHWRLSKVVLLQHTKEWNKALEKYCDDMGLTGAEREAVVQKHTANPCAPCSNPSCNKWETEPKEFKTCSRCKAVAYCSSDCQKKDWKTQHKSTCVAI